MNCQVSESKNSVTQLCRLVKLGHLNKLEQLHESQEPLSRVVQRIEHEVAARGAPPFPSDCPTSTIVCPLRAIPPHPEQL